MAARLVEKGSLLRHNAPTFGPVISHSFNLVASAPRFNNIDRRTPFACRLLSSVTLRSARRQLRHCRYFSTSKISQRIYEAGYPLPPLPPPTSLFHFHFPPSTSSASRIFPPESVAYVDSASSTTLTRADLFSLSLRLGYGLRQNLGLKKGDVVMIISPNSLAYPVAFFGAQAAGLVVTLANSGYKARELAYQIKDSGCKIVFLAEELVGVAKDALKMLEDEEGASSLPRLVLLASKPSENKKDLISHIDLLSTAEQARGWEGEYFNGDQADETAVLCYSSGTTGLPKGVMTTHRNLIVQQTIFSEAMVKLTPEAKDKSLALLPFSHIFGLALVLLHPLTQNVPVVVLPRFTPHQFLTTIEQHRITWSFIVPPIVNLLAHSPMIDRHDLSSLRGLLSGAAPMSAEIASKAMDRLKKPITQGYGLTETSPATHVLPLEEASKKVGSIGRLLPSLTARIIDASGKDVPEGQVGEMVLQGPTVMKGYWKNPAATKDTFTKEGWYRTGDVARVDEDGCWYIVDRLKELIKYKGFQVPPAELESLLLSHPKIADAGVIGIYSSIQETELPRAYVVPRGGMSEMTEKEKTTLEREVVDWVASKVAAHKWLRGGVELLNTIPRSSSGKILRLELREMAKRREVEE